MRVTFDAVAHRGDAPDWLRSNGLAVKLCGDTPDIAPYQGLVFDARCQSVNEQDGQMRGLTAEFKIHPQDPFHHSLEQRGIGKVFLLESRAQQDIAYKACGCRNAAAAASKPTSQRERR